MFAEPFLWLGILEEKMIDKLYIETGHSIWEKIDSIYNEENFAQKPDLSEEYVLVKNLKIFIEQLQKGLYKQQKDETKLERLLEELENNKVAKLYETQLDKIALLNKIETLILKIKQKRKNIAGLGNIEARATELKNILQNINMKCKYCNKKIILDSEGDLVHTHLINKGVDPRLCEPSNPDSKIAK